MALGSQHQDATWHVARYCSCGQCLLIPHNRTGNTGNASRRTGGEDPLQPFSHNGFREKLAKGAGEALCEL